MSLPLRITIRLVLTIILVWVIQRYLHRYVVITGGFPGWIVVASLLTLMNLLVRPLLTAIAAPLHILASLLALIIVNGLFAAILVWIAGYLEPDLVTITIVGFPGWIVVPIVLGAGNWVIKIITDIGAENS
jgi:uncharacterized membrane protein YvlD (DUF360 family)